MKTIFKNENWKPYLVLFFLYEKKIIYSFITPLYNCITLTIQEKCIKYTKAYKAIIYKIL